MASKGRRESDEQIAAEILRVAVASDDPVPVEFLGITGMCLCAANEDGAAIATRDDYESFRESYAHFRADGTINRHGQIIGTARDIKIVGKSKREAKHGKV